MMGLMEEIPTYIIAATRHLADVHAKKSQIRDYTYIGSPDGLRGRAEGRYIVVGRSALDIPDAIWDDLAVLHALFGIEREWVKV